MNSTRMNQPLAQIMNSIGGVELKEKRNGQFRFRMYLSPQMSAETIETLDLSVRSYNSLKRAGFHTVGELAEAVAGGMSLKSIRNCGRTSAREIMEHLFLYQYNSLRPESRDAYLREVAAMNPARSSPE